MCLFFSGAVLGHHVYLITDGSTVTSSITLYKYMCYVIITRRRPYLSVVRSPMLRNVKLCKVEMESLCLGIFTAKWNVIILQFII